MMLETDDPRVNLSNGQFAAKGNIGDNDGTVISANYLSILSYNTNTVDSGA